MSDAKALKKAVQADPHDPLPCFAMADLLEEQGRPDLAFCYRWMGWYGRRPGHREGKAIRKRFVWYGRVYLRTSHAEAEQYAALKWARLNEAIYRHMWVDTDSRQYRLYSTWEEAVAALAEGLPAAVAGVAEPAGGAQGRWPVRRYRRNHEHQSSRRRERHEGDTQGPEEGR